jgi:hypothetical protein
MGFFGRQVWRRTLLLTAVLAAVGAQTGWAQTWNCGVGADSTKVKATLSSGTLTISGTGKIKDYNNYPDTYWGSSTSSIAKVIIEDGVTSIGDEIFQRCTSLTSVTIPNSVTSIGNGVFKSCKKLPSIIIPSSVISVGNWMFQYCEKLTSVTIPNSITSISEGMFYASGLTSVIIPSSVTSIKTYAFEACSDLKSISIPNSVTSIGSHSNVKKPLFLKVFA